jgi:hypothetical protein
MAWPPVRFVFLAVALFAAGGARGARAADLFGASTVSGVIVGGVSAGSGETSWLNGRLGKLATGGDEVRIDSQAIVAWRGRLSDRLGTLVSVDAQSLADPVIGLDEAYLTLRASPADAVQFSGRAGLFFPPVSLEHDGSEWALSDTLTPSAINTWIAEEVKVAGVEVTLRGSFAKRPASLTAAAFQGNDTSGALMAFRGWAMHDLRATLGGTFGLPTVPAMFAGKQAPSTRPVDEIDGRWGGYSRAEIALRDNLKISLFAYDNNGDRTTVIDGQYAWRTRFAQSALRWTPGSKTQILVQAMTGETSMGVAVGGLEPADVGFSAAYVLLSRDLTNSTAAVRIDQFSVSDRTFKASDNNAEHGWAGTLAWRAPVSARSEILFEAIGSHGVRRDRARFGVAPAQDSAQIRAAFRAAF